MPRATFTIRALVALLAPIAVGSILSESTELPKIRVTTWNLEWFPNGSAHDSTPEVQAQRIAAAADVLRSINRELCQIIMTFRDRVEALPIRPIGHILHAANPSLKIHLLPNAGTDRNVRSSEYLAEPAVDQCIVRQCSSFLLSSNCSFTSQLVPFISRPDSRQSAFKNRTLPPSTFYGSGETKFPDKVQAEHCLALLLFQNLETFALDLARRMFYLMRYSNGRQCIIQPLGMRQRFCPFIWLDAGRFKNFPAPTVRFDFNYCH
jgi:hypothetical protein